MNEIKLAYKKVDKGVTSSFEKTIDLDNIEHKVSMLPALQYSFTVAECFYDFIESIGLNHEIVLGTYQEILESEDTLVDLDDIDADAYEEDSDLEEPATVESADDGPLNFDTFCTKFGNDMEFREKLFTMYQLYEGNED